MAEYINVEKPFLDILSQLVWQVIDQGIGIPQEPEKLKQANTQATQTEKENRIKMTSLI